MTNDKTQPTSPIDQTQVGIASILNTTSVQERERAMKEQQQDPLKVWDPMP